MSRAGYTDDIGDQWQYIMWRGAVASSIRGKRGQAFLRELIAALDALPEKKLIANRLQRDNCYCALGAIARCRGLDVRALDAPYDCALEDLDAIDHKQFAEVFGVASALLREIQYENDEHWLPETDEQRWQRMRDWAIANLRETQR